MKDGWLFRLGVPVALVLYAVLTFGFGQSRQIPGVAILLSAGVYLTIVFLFAGIPSLLVRGQKAPLVAGMIVAVGWSATWIGADLPLFVWVMTWSLLLGSTMMTGYLAGKGYRFSVVYSTGLLIVMVISLLQYIPLYPVMSEIARNGVDGIVGNMRMQMTVSGYTPGQIDEFVSAFHTVLNTMIRLMPCGFVLGAGVQYSLGYIWFGHRVVAPSGRPAVVPSFAEWRAPFGLAVLVLAGSALRLLGGETVKLIADNLLVGLGVIYAIMGMSLIESFLRKAHVGWLGRVFVYVALFLAQIVGLLVVALLGFIDSYVDWRARAQRSIDETI